MQKNLYYRHVIQRQNLFKALTLSFFFAFASWPRLLLEVFIRKNFGERYFRLSSAITVAVLLTALPFFLDKLNSSVAMTQTDFNPFAEEPAATPSGSGFLKSYIGWFIFLAGFVVVSVYRHLEIKRNPSVFDFAKYSLYGGKIHPFFYGLKIGGKAPSLRLIESVLEPLPFLIAGVLLYMAGQSLGTLLIVCSIFYSLGYVAAYDIGDNFVMDTIDQIICNEELKSSFVDGKDEEQTRYFRFVGDRPDDPAKRSQILPLLMENEADTYIAK